MLRSLYLAAMYLHHQGTLGQLLRRAPSQPPALPETAQQGEDLEHKQCLKRRVIRRKLDVWAVVSSFIADIDVVADWYYYAHDLAEAGNTLQKTGLVYALLGTLLWFVHATEGHVVEKGIRLMVSLFNTVFCGAREAAEQESDETVLGYLEHFPLRLQLSLNVAFEDLPQLIITFLADDVGSVAGVLNVATASLAFLAKVVDIIQKTEAEIPLVIQLRMVDAESAIMHGLLDSQEKVEEEARTSARIVTALAGLSKGSKTDRSARAYWILQAAPDHVGAVQRRFREKELVLEYREGSHRFCCPQRQGLLLTGQIPPQLGSLTKITQLRVSKFNMTGGIPPELGSLVGLQTLDLSFNRLTGGIPTELSRLVMLQSLNLSGNELTGEIPREFSSLGSLHSLSLSRNALTGGIPRELSSLLALQTLDLSGNELTGGIPTELGRLDALLILDLSDNNLSGGIPTELSGLASLQSLDLSSNMLTGKIPKSLGSLVALQTLYISNNQLTGGLPKELGSLVALRSLYVNHSLADPTDRTSSQLLNCPTACPTPEEPKCAQDSSARAHAHITRGLRLCRKYYDDTEDRTSLPQPPCFRFNRAQATNSLSLGKAPRLASAGDDAESLATLVGRCYGTLQTKLKPSSNALNCS